MTHIRLVFPTKKDQEKILDYKKEFMKYQDSLDGTGGLGKTEDVEEWFQAVYDNASEETVREGMVPSTTYLAISGNDEVVGMIDIRHRLNEYLYRFGGHIGYSVRKSQRQKGYATEMLRLALEKCKKLQIDTVLITCDKNNIASAKTIMKNGGILENEVPEGNRITQRYWIKLNE